MLTENPSLLITDDDCGLREVLQELFEARGFQSYVASDGEEAIEIVQTRSIHLVILDMHMPRLTGLETLRRLKRFYQLLPCILMSAELDQRVIAEAQQLNAFSVLAKPLSLKKITNAVHSALKSAYDWDE